MLKIRWIVILLSVLIFSCKDLEKTKSVHFVVKNPEQGAKMSQKVTLETDPKFIGWSVENHVSEWVEKEDGSMALEVMVALEPGTETSLTLVPEESNTPDLAHAELSVRTNGKWEEREYKAQGFDFTPVTTFESPEQLTDHSYYLRYEGPGWENDLIGYRLYLDWRNAIDVFVKTDSELVLDQVGLDGYDSYHELADWGGDALKVGKSLGVGALGRVSGDAIMHFQHVENTRWDLDKNTKLQAGFTINYAGWRSAAEADDEVDVSTEYEIVARDPSSSIKVSLSRPIEGLVTGLVKHKGTEDIRLNLGNWSVIGTWGKQNLLAPDAQLGMALFYQNDQVEKVSTSSIEHLLHFKSLKEFEYLIFATWPGHPKGPQNQTEFEAQLNEKLRALAAPAYVVYQ
ncbi:DUF4861 family protein [Glaciecola sp. 1036]|uniref:DUF4861 family protein n=1 Tax=Alteromonadaceae TaxID=72275 RepID=UPI003D043943